MDMMRYFDVTHASHAVMNPSSVARMDELALVLGVTAETRVLDLACGHAELLLRWNEAHAATGVGVDASTFHIERARRHKTARVPDAAIDLVHGRGEEFATAERFDVVSCLGASWIWNGFAGTLRALAAFGKPQAAIVCGEPYWIEAPPPEYLEMEGLRADQFHDLGGCLETGIQQGLELVWMARSTAADWDRYEMRQSASVDAFAREFPDDPDLAEIRALRRAYDRSYLRWGNRCLGWAIWVFRAP